MAERNEPLVHADGDGMDGIENYLLPMASSTRLAKEALPESFKMARDLPPAIQVGTSIFISYLTTFALQVAQNHHRSTISGNDLIEAAEQLKMSDDGLVVALKTAQKRFEVNKQATKQQSKATEPKKAGKESDKVPLEMEAIATNDGIDINGHEGNNQELAQSENEALEEEEEELSDEEEEIMEVTIEEPQGEIAAVDHQEEVDNSTKRDIVMKNA